MLRHDRWGVALASVALTALLGCGVEQSSNPQDGGGTGGLAPDRGGFAFRVQWPDAAAEFIPQSSQSIVLQITATATDEKQGEALLTREDPAVTFNDLPPGTECLITATAHPVANGTGTPQAEGEVIATVPMGAVEPLELTLGTTISSIRVNPASVPLTETDPGRQLTATALNADDAIVLTSGEWTYEGLDPSIVAVSADGVVTPGALGVTSIVVTEVESGVSTTVRAGTAPPHVSPDLYRLNGSAGIDWRDSTRALVGLNAILDPATDVALSGLDGTNFYIVEDGFLLGTVAVQSSKDGGAAVDICFVLDSSGSMYWTIDGVRDSVTTFVENLADSGMSSHVGGVHFDNGPPIGMFDLTADVDEFSIWVGGITASGGSWGGENPLDAVADARDQFQWRGGVQRVFVTVTDEPSIQRNSGYGSCTTSLEDVVNSLRGSFVVHAVSMGTDFWFAPPSAAAGGEASAEGRPHPASPAFRPVASTRGTDDFTYPDDVEFDVQILAEATGGTWMQLPWSGGVFDLNQLPILDTLLDGYLVGFSRSGPSKAHTVRVVLALGGSYVGDATFDGTY